MQITIPFEVDDSKIRIERARIKLSQKELAEKVDTSREKINFIENAKCKTVKYELLEKLANVFKMETEDLLKKER